MQCACLFNPIMQMGFTADTFHFLLIVSYKLQCQGGYRRAGQAVIHGSKSTFQEWKRTQAGASPEDCRVAGWGKEGSSARFWSEQHTVAEFRNTFRIAKISHRSKRVGGEIKARTLGDRV